MLTTVVGVGVDVADVARFERALARRPALVERLFRPDELAFVTAKAGRTARLAARFAAKEAVLKAIGIGLREGSWQDVRIGRDGLGKPDVTLSGGIAAAASARGIEKVLISMSHDGGVAMATAVAGR